MDLCNDAGDACVGVGLLLFVGCLTSQQCVSVSQGRICSNSSVCCHTEIEAADQTFCLTQSQYTDTGPTSTSTDLIMPGTCRGANPSVLGGRSSALRNFFRSIAKSPADENSKPSARFIHFQTVPRSPFSLRTVHREKERWPESSDAVISIFSASQGHVSSEPINAQHAQ